jgi:4-nitrophenyl phosphatase
MHESAGPHELCRELRGLIIDMDGVLWRGDTPLPGLLDFFEVLRRQEIRFVLATNNNTRTPAEFAEKLRRMGVEVDPAAVLTASVATVHYLKAHFPPGSRLYAVAEAPFKALIEAAGFILAERKVAAVVASLDRAITYDMFKRATLLIRAGAEFIGANPDPTYPTEEGLVPGSGMVLAALAATTGRQPIVMGKPEHWMFDIALERMGLPAAQVASLGDRLETDILGGQRAGLKTILVLSGITTPDMLAASPVRPTWVFSGIEELAARLRGEVERV